MLFYNKNQPYCNGDMAVKMHCKLKIAWWDIVGQKSDNSVSKPNQQIPHFTYLHTYNSSADQTNMK